MHRFSTSSRPLHGAGAIVITPILRTRKLTPREITFLAQGRTEYDWQFEPRLSGSRAEPKLKPLACSISGTLQCFLGQKNLRIETH